MGFPWVDTVGVLIYLTGLAGIDEAVYEAGDLDGVSWLQKFLYIELPLILTQVRINLVVMIIGTLQTYGQILILLGNAGGPAVSPWCRDSTCSARPSLSYVREKPAPWGSSSSSSSCCSPKSTIAASG